jgi:GNAT superfamily N-acetyltransferase
VPLDWGSAIFHDDFPRWADVNTVRVEVPVADLDAERLHGAVERLQGRLGHRRIEVWDDDTAHRLEDGMTALGYERGRSVLMGWDGGEPEAGACGEPSPEQVPYRMIERLREEWLRDDPWAPDADTLAQALAADRLTFEHTPTRAYAVVRDGRALAYGLLVDIDGIALVEDVYATPAARGQGLAGAVVRRLVWESRVSGHADTVLATDAGGRARELYARLGFTPLGTVNRFLRRPGP